MKTFPSLIARFRQEIYAHQRKHNVSHNRLAEILHTRLTQYEAECFSDVPVGQLPKLVDKIKKDMEK